MGIGRRSPAAGYRKKRRGTLPGQHLTRISVFKCIGWIGAAFFVAAGVPPAVAGGILPPVPTTGVEPGPQLLQPSRARMHFSAGRDARLYGRQDARRYRKMRARCIPRLLAI